MSSGSRAIIAEMQPDAAGVAVDRDVDPAFREYERTCVTAFDAYIKPVVADYLANMERGLRQAGVSRAAAGDAVARRPDVLGDRAAAAGAAVPVRPRRRRGRRRWMPAAPPASAT